MSVISVLDWWKFVVSIFSWQTYHGKLLQVYASEPFLAEDLPCFQILIIKVDSTSVGPLGCQLHSNICGSTLPLYLNC